MDIQRAIQYFFSEQWDSLMQYATSNGAGIIGDLLIYVAHDNVDVWLHCHLFQMDDKGQLWGNPLYDWPRHAKDHFACWQQKLGHGLKGFDLLRLDHFRRFAGYWSIPAEHETAENGRWIEAPGQQFFLAMQKALPKLSIIVEI